MESLSVWIIYDHPVDYPNGFVARRAEVSTEPPLSHSFVYAGDLASLRREMRSRRLFRIPRDPKDYPKIIETWI